MIYQLFSIYDEVLEKFNLPFAAINEKEAIRNLTHACMDQNSQLYKSPQDYSLYLVGTFTDDNANYDNIEPKKLIIRTTQIIQSINNQNSES